LWNGLGWCSFFQFQTLYKALTDNNLHIIPPTADEAGLLLRTAAGDESAFRELFGMYQPSLLYLVHKITRNMGAAEEAVQDIFLKVWLTRESLYKIQHFKNYIFIVARNQALNVLDKQVRERNKQQDYQRTTEESRESSDNGLPYHLIDEAIHRLPQQQRRAWLLSRHEGMSYEEIGTRLSISQKTVKRHIRLATDSIKDYVVTHNTELLVLLLVANYL
jgi:RNA polymerase sigma-70 factor (family 1)